MESAFPLTMAAMRSKMPTKRPLISPYIFDKQFKNGRAE